jgi:hypothetical protein
MSSQGIMSGKETYDSPGLHLLKGKSLALVPRQDASSLITYVFKQEQVIHLIILHLMWPDSGRVTYEVLHPNETVGGFLERNLVLNEWTQLLHRVYNLSLLISSWIQFLDSGLLNFNTVLCCK